MNGLQHDHHDLIGSVMHVYSSDDDKRRGELAGLEKLSPHDLRRTATTKDFQQIVLDAFKEKVFLLRLIILFYSATSLNKTYSLPLG